MSRGTSTDKKDQRSDRKRAVGMNYFLVSHDGAFCKVGYAESPKACRSRVKSQVNVSTMAFFAAIEGERTHEQETHRYLRSLGLGVDEKAEVFRCEGELAEYLDWLTTRAWAALALDELDETYPAPTRFVFQDWRADDAANPQGILPLATRLLVPSKRHREYSSESRVLATLRSESGEWHTPAIYVNAAREVMGGIDLDPASNYLANRTVRATEIFTAAEDGLRYHWHGRVWLNPPYGGKQSDFIDHLLDEWAAGNVTEAILCLNAHGTDTQWFQRLVRFPLCFTHHRPRFIGGAKGKEPDEVAPTTGIVFPYVGPNADLFAKVFSRFGPILELRHPATTTTDEFREIIRDGRDWRAS